MKYLLINRHAKSPWKNLNVSDHDRELDETGFSDALMMGKRLFDKSISFDLMLTSSATRALTTCQLIASEIKYPLENIKVDSSIYGSGIEDIQKIICAIDSDSVESLAIFGHNPTFHILSEKVSGQVIQKFPTCGMMYIQFDTHKWSNCFNSNVETIFFDFPKNG